MGLPTLVVVSGPPGAGKTTLAHRIAGTPGLERLTERSQIKVIRCTVDAATAGSRAARRNVESRVRQRSHATPETPFFADDWRGISLPLPLLSVETTEGYKPGIDAIIRFVLGD